MALPRHLHLSLSNDTDRTTAFLPTISSPSPLPQPLSHVRSSETESTSSLSRQGHETTETLQPVDHAPSRPTPLGQLPTGKELEDLVELYFSSVHHFGFFAFIHQLHFNRLLAKGKAPRELTLIMIASAMRFAAHAVPENLVRADAWADAAIGTLLPRIYQGFGAIQLMTLLLAQHYDLNRGNFTSAWLLGASCTRMMQMMSLQTLDRTYPAKFAANLRLSPLLSCEALRRVAWCAFYADTIVDGGRYGFHIVDENSYRLQLPCDMASFLGDETVVTEPLFVVPSDPANTSTASLDRAPLDMSAYLLRTAAARRRALHFAFRASHRERTSEQLSAELVALEADIEDVIAALPRRFHFNTNNMILHRDRLITFILLHILRHNLYIVVGRAALQVYQRDSAKADLIPQVRRNRISHALPIAGLISEGLKAGISFDPQIGVQAYVALEILLFEPRRLAEIDPFLDPKAPALMEAIPHLLTVIRDIADRSEFVKQLHVEAVHRLLRCGHSHFLNQTDFTAFRSEYRLVCQDPAEYDFRDFRWAKLERLRRGVRPSTNAGRDEALLEYESGGETASSSAATSPRLDAIDVRYAASRPSAAQRGQSVPSAPSNELDLPAAQSIDGVGMAQTLLPWWGLGEPENPDQMFSLDWSWFLAESGHPGYQTGDLTRFSSQL
ncbi:uncharacterized protein Z518_02115 [Rhinocladiella mackenziei CBS 650.93]|uniref:Rhinocladiella mackenziei CBS 650.93 unplaced genomic scaffold supercont1.2, whole genome shotgun sequence n=1 Tax=Rhinocladiella mackenziei CBS 650.93 TaxID=1442369 RepID=A0A0D2FYW2_9EURO|nr:uncharacterized protein Z518_02115 [Rhinocladiella mackenziei CBS 650.93]KIX07462.1 hypothetical protein Z518_02115 [Rhinocladiella mackenziei CBS 650.93]